MVAQRGLIDFMAEDGIVGQYNGSKARDVLMSLEDWHEQQGLDPPESDHDEGELSAEDDEAEEEYEEEEYEEYEDVD